MLIDTHCHLTDEKISDVRSDLEVARTEGVRKVIIPSTSLRDARKALEIAENEGQYCLAGIHPEEIDSVNDVNEMIKDLRAIIKSSLTVVGVGEIGLDFYWDKEKKTKEKQIEIFKAQLELAENLKLPVAVHMRNAEEEMKKILTEAKISSGQLHCFAGSEEFLEFALKKGFYISFCGNITYKSAENLRNLLPKVPLERLLLETDSPYLPPEPLRGSVNTPANVKIIAEFIAKELGLSLSDLASITSKNAKCLYSLDI